MADGTPSPTLRIGVDLGETKIEAIALDSDGVSCAQRRVATPRGDYRATLQAIADVVRAVEAELGQTGTVGIAMPGTLSPASGLVKNANSTWLNRRPLDRDLEALLNRPLRFANGADCFALSEAIEGAGAGAGVVFGVIIGTSIGGGIVIKDELLQGPNGVAGEWGHNPLPWMEIGEFPGQHCYCGKRGCIETWLSEPGLVRDHRIHSGADLDAQGIAAAAATGDSTAEASLRRYETRLARALASVINILDPEVIVLGGELSRLERLYERVPRWWRKYVFSDRVDTRLLPPRHGDSSGVRGAAWLWPEPGVRQEIIRMR